MIAAVLLIRVGTLRRMVVKKMIRILYTMMIWNKIKLMT